MGAVFLPVLFCVFFVDGHIKYYERWRIITLLPNTALFVIALFGVSAVCLSAWMLRKMELTAKANTITNLALAFLFVWLYLANVWIAREIAFKLPWDILAVTTHAAYLAEGNTLDNNVYFSIYTNNIPIVYILKQLYVEAMEMKDYPYVRDFIGIQANCALLSAGGFFGCLTIKKLTKKIVPTIIYFLLYLALIGLTPWKIAPYTDMYGLPFPIMSIYFYLCCRDAKKEVIKYLTMALALTSAAAGGLVKPSVYILIIAIFFYQMLFEARARYLIVFLPLLVVVSVSGIWQYAEWSMKWVRRRGIGKSMEE